MIELTETQRQELERGGAVDVGGYIMLRKDVYERLQALLDELPGPSLMNEVMAEDDAHDPYLESCQPQAQRRR